MQESRYEMAREGIDEVATFLDKPTSHKIQMNF